MGKIKIQCEATTRTSIRLNNPKSAFYYPVGDERNHVNVVPKAILPLLLGVCFVVFMGVIKP